jgi:hypothetical protein
MDHHCHYLEIRQADPLVATWRTHWAITVAMQASIVRACSRIGEMGEGEVNLGGFLEVD